MTPAQDRISLMARLLSLVEQPVDRFGHDPFQLRIDIGSREGHTIVLEGRTRLHVDGIEDWVGEPEGQAGSSHTELLGGAEVLGAYVSPAGDLRLDLTDGRWISTEATEDFEAWSVYTDDGLLAVCLPGGELTLWPEAQQTPEE